MEGLILNERTEYVTYLCPIFDAVGDDYIRSLNWRIIYPECGSAVSQGYSFEGKEDSWISGNQLVEEVRNNPDIQWWWGLLQGFDQNVSRSEAMKEEPVDIQEDTEIWKNPVTMRNPKAQIEIEAFDSTLTVVIAKEDAVLEKLKIAFPDHKLLSEYNDRRYKLKFLFDWGSGVCLWSANKNSEERFGDYPIPTNVLPVSQELRDELEHLIAWHDEALNWDNPGGPLLWDERKIQEFMAAAKDKYIMLCHELGEDYEIEFFEQM